MKKLQIVNIRATVGTFTEDNLPRKGDMSSSRKSPKASCVHSWLEGSGQLLYQAFPDFYMIFFEDKMLPFLMS
jgi:hypothetical protein